MVSFYYTIAIIAAVLLIAFVGYIATRPAVFRIERTMGMRAPREKIFAFITDLHNWDSWSPWEKLDPAMKKTHSGAASGKGAAYDWEGNKNVGAGRLEIAETSPPAKITMNLHFLRPFACRNVVEYTLQPQGDSTNVTWAMHGPNLFMGKVMSLFMNMDRMVGKSFEEGLAKLKAIMER